MRLLSRAVTVLVLAVALAARPLAAQLTVGQSFTAPGAPNSVLQQITVAAAGLSGSGATAVDPFVAQIFAVSGSLASGGTLVGASLFSQVLGTSFTGFTLTPNLALVGGTYAVLVGAPAGVSFTQGVGPEVDIGGQAIVCNGTFCNAQFFEGRDRIGFAATFGPAVSAVPEPGTWALLGTGLLALGGVAAQRRRTTV